MSTLVRTIHWARAIQAPGPRRCSIRLTSGLVERIAGPVPVSWLVDIEQVARQRTPVRQHPLGTAQTR